MMKKLTILIAAFLIVAGTATAANLTASQGNLQLKMINYQPVPAHPGDTLDVWVKVENNGGGVAKDIRLQLQDNYPFIVEEVNKTRRIGTLPGGYDYVAKYKVRVRQQAPVGQAYLKARVKRAKTQLWQEEFLPLEIESRITSLSIQNVNSSKYIAPGKEGKLQITVQNLADSLIRDLSAKLELEGSNAPLVPVRSSTEKKLDRLESKENKTFTFNLMAELDAEANAYRIPLNLSFKEDNGDKVSFSDTVGVVVRSKPELVTTIESANVYSDKPRGDVTLKFVNKGVDEIKFLNVKMLPSESYKLLSATNEFYIGNIRSDDYDIEDLTVEASNKNRINIPMEVQYRDAANNFFKENTTVSMNLVKRASVEGEESNTTTYLIVGVVVLALIIYIWRRKKKSRK